MNFALSASILLLIALGGVHTENSKYRLFQRHSLAAPLARQHQVDNNESTQRIFNLLKSKTTTTTTAEPTVTTTNNPPPPAPPGEPEEPPEEPEEPPAEPEEPPEEPPPEEAPPPPEEEPPAEEPPAEEPPAEEPPGEEPPPEEPGGPPEGPPTPPAPPRKRSLLEVDNDNILNFIRNNDNDIHDDDEVNQSENILQEKLRKAADDFSRQKSMKRNVSRIVRADAVGQGRGLKEVGIVARKRRVQRQQQLLRQEQAHRREHRQQQQRRRNHKRHIEQSGRQQLNTQRIQRHRNRFKEPKRFVPESYLRENRRGSKKNKKLRKRKQKLRKTSHRKRRQY